jgi:ClpP class serine protease
LNGFNYFWIINKVVQQAQLYLYTRGGNTLAAWTLVNLIRNFCKDFEVIVPFNCHSAGTLISLGANRIVMTKQATLGPIDPSVNGPLNLRFQAQTIQMQKFL